MKVSKQQLNKMVQESISDFLKENHSADKQLIDSLNQQFTGAIKDIEAGIKKYHSVMSMLETNAQHPKVKDIGLRGMETSKHELERWHTIADDLYVAKWEVEYDEEDEKARIQQASDEHENRGTLGEPKI